MFIESKFHAKKSGKNNKLILRKRCYSQTVGQSWIYRTPRKSRWLVHYSFIWFHQTVPSQSQTNWEINLNFYFHFSLWYLKRIYEGMSGLHKTFCGTIKKCEIKNFQLIFILIQLSENQGVGRVKYFILSSELF